MVLGLPARAPAGEAGERPGPAIFVHADLVPDDADLAVTITDGAALRPALERLLLGAWLEQAFLGPGRALPEVWNRLADRVGRPAGLLFDEVLGDRATLVLRRDVLPGGVPGAGAEPPREWALVTEVGRDRMRLISSRLGLHFGPPRAGFSVGLLPEHGLLIAQRGDLVVIGPSDRSALADRIMQRASGHGLGLPVPTDERRWAAARELAGHLPEGTAHVGAWIRHGDPAGGSSVLAGVLDADGERLVIRHAARFDRPPFSRRVTQEAADFSVVGVLADRSMLVIAEPTDIGPTNVEMMMEQSYGLPLVSTPMRRNGGELRVFAIAEEEGRLRKTPEDVVSASVAAAVQMRDLDGALAHLDHHCTNLLRRVGALVGRPAALEVPSVESLLRGDCRSVSLEPLLAGGADGPEPLLGSVELSWDVVDGAYGRWYLMTTHRDQLADLRHALATRRRDGTPIEGRYDSVGAINGPIIARMLESWSERAADLAEPGRTEDFRAAVLDLAALARGLDRVLWRLHRPSTDAATIDVEITLGSRRPSSRP